MIFQKAICETVVSFIILFQKSSFTKIRKTTWPLKRCNLRARTKSAQINHIYFVGICIANPSQLCQGLLISVPPPYLPNPWYGHVRHLRKDSDHDGIKLVPESRILTPSGERRGAYAEPKVPLKPSNVCSLGIRQALDLHFDICRLSFGSVYFLPRCPSVDAYCVCP